MVHHKTRDSQMDARKLPARITVGYAAGCSGCTPTQALQDALGLAELPALVTPEREEVTETAA